VSCSGVSVEAELVDERGQILLRRAEDSLCALRKERAHEVGGEALACAVIICRRDAW